MSRLVILLFGIAFAFAVPGTGSATDEAAPSHRISIPAQSLDTALQELAKQSGIQIIFFSQVLEGRDAPALSGTFTTEAALNTLLAGTGLTFQPVNDRTIQVFAQAGAATAALSDARRPNPLSEVEISAEREKLWRMRAEIASIEQRFFDEYNAINTDDDFDIHCNLWPWQRLNFGDARRLCQHAFVGDVVSFPGGGGSGGGINGGAADAGLAGIQGGFLTGSAVGQAGYGPYGPFVLDQSAKWAAYEKHVLELINRYPQLRKILSEREALEQRYKKIRAEKLKRHFLVQ